MNDEDRKTKNEAIRKSLNETRLRHASMRPVVIELKLDLKCLNNAERSKLFLFFAECRWLCNYLIGLATDKFRAFSTKTRSIASLDKDKNTVARELTMPAKFIQAVYSSLKQDMKSLAAKRKKNGALKFRSSYDSIELNQYGNTHWICFGPSGNKHGKYKNTVHIAGIKRPIRVFGMEQIPAGAEYANAKLMKRPSGIYLMLTCYERLRPLKVRSMTYRSENRNASRACRRSLPARERVPGAGMTRRDASRESMRGSPAGGGQRQSGIP